MPDMLQKESFSPHLNSAFEIFPEGMDKVTVELVELTEKKAEYTEAFSVIFRGPADAVLNQGSHMFKHPKMGEIELFVTPVNHSKKDGVYYQAVFNRLIKPLYEDR